MELLEEDLKGGKKERPLARKQGPATLYLHSLTRAQLGTRGQRC